MFVYNNLGGSAVCLTLCVLLFIMCSEYFERASVRSADQQYDLQTALLEWVHEAHLVTTFVNSTKGLCIVPPLLCALAQDECYIRRPPPTHPLPKGPPKRKRMTASTPGKPARRRLGVDDSTRTEQSEGQQAQPVTPVRRARTGMGHDSSSEQDEEEAGSSRGAGKQAQEAVTLANAVAPEGYKILHSCPIDPQDPDWKTSLLGKTVLCAFDRSVYPDKQHGWFRGRVASTAVHKKYRKREGGGQLTHEVLYPSLPKGENATPVYHGARVPHDLSAKTYGAHKWWVELKILESDDEDMDQE